jgi:hypothetical protein
LTASIAEVRERNLLAAIIIIVITAFTIAITVNHRHHHQLPTRPTLPYWIALLSQGYHRLDFHKLQIEANCGRHQELLRSSPR